MTAGHEEAITEPAMTAPKPAVKASSSTTGPATMFPRLSPRPTPPPASQALWNFLVTSTRGPILTALCLHWVLLGFYRRVGKWLADRLGSERAAFGAMLPLVHSTTYCLTFALFETVERNGWFERYRIGRTPGQEPTWEMKRAAFWETARGWPTMGFLGQIFYLVLERRGSPSLLSRIPSLAYTCKHLVLGLLASNVTFYVLHRLLHHPKLYASVHKKHHEFVGVKSVAAQSLHPIETVLQTIPVLVGAVAFSTHPLVWLHLLGWRVYIGMEGHSGYSFRGSIAHKLGLTIADEAAYHDCHHTSYGNFGTFYLDWLFGTQDYWISIGEEDGYIALCRKRENEARAREAEIDKLQTECLEESMMGECESVCSSSA